MLPTWAFQRLTNVAGGRKSRRLFSPAPSSGEHWRCSGAALAEGDFNGQLALSVGGNTLLFAPDSRPS
jgi:hypothetical protein